MTKLEDTQILEMEQAFINAFRGSGWKEENGTFILPVDQGCMKAQFINSYVELELNQTDGEIIMAKGMDSAQAFEILKESLANSYNQPLNLNDHFKP